MNLDVFKRCILFDEMTDEEIETVVRDLYSIKVPAGKSVVTENTLGESLFVILKGSVEITKELAENDENMVAQLKIMDTGDFFGEMSLIDDEPRSASVVARDDVEVLIIPKERFLEIAYSNPRVLFNLIRTLSWRLRDTNQKFTVVMEKLIAQNRLMAIGMAASKIIHDIKTPLTVIVLTAELIENLCPESKEFADGIVAQTRAVDQMVREILDFAKGHTTPINPQKVNLDKMLKNVRESFVKTLTGRSIDIIINNTITHDVCFDEPKVNRVLHNLIKNSSEALSTHGYIGIDARMEDSHLVITVTDNGPGLSEHIKANLFSPFQTEGKPHGTGLGLAITQKLVHEHKGTIEYKANAPSGSMFVIKLPQHGPK